MQSFFSNAVIRTDLISAMIKKYLFEGIFSDKKMKEILLLLGKDYEKVE